MNLCSRLIRMVELSLTVLDVGEYLVKILRWFQLIFHKTRLWPFIRTASPEAVLIRGHNPCFIENFKEILRITIKYFPYLDPALFSWKGLLLSWLMKQGYMLEGRTLISLHICSNKCLYGPWNSMYIFWTNNFDLVLDWPCCRLICVRSHSFRLAKIWEKICFENTCSQ